MRVQSARVRAPLLKGGRVITRLKKVIQNKLLSSADQSTF